jgi:lysophospholipase L1-like esterase
MSLPRSGVLARSLLALTGAALLAYAISDHPFYGDEPGFGLTQKAIAAAAMLVAACALLPARFAGSALLLTFVSLGGLVVLEVAAEALLAPLHRPIYQADPQLIFKFVPGSRSAMVHSPANGGATILHRINSAGFRGPELRPAGQATRVVVYGDSFIHAFYTPDEETFVAQLGQALSRGLGAPVEAVNAGVSSYGPDQIALKMLQELPALRPDLVIVAVFAGNDYGDLMRNKMFRLDADGALVVNPWKLDPQVQRRLELSQQESMLKRAARAAMAARRAAPNEAPVDMAFLLEEARREYESVVVKRDDIVTNTHIDYYSADVSLTPDSPSARYKVALMKAVLQRIAAVAKEHAVPLAFLFIPHPMDLAEGYDAWKPVDRARFPAYDGRNQTAPLEAAAASLGVPYLSLYEPFRAKGPQAHYLRGGDDHWNAAGQQAAAAAMAELVQQRGLAKPRPRAP